MIAGVRPGENFAVVGPRRPTAYGLTMTRSLARELAAAGAVQVAPRSASPAPPKVAQQIYTQATLTKMCVRFYRGEAMETTLAWAQGDLEGFMRS